MQEGGAGSALLRWRAKQGGTPRTRCTPGVGTGLQSDPEGRGCLEVRVGSLCSNCQDHDEGSFFPPKPLAPLHYVPAYAHGRAGTRVPDWDCAPAAAEVVRGGGTSPDLPGGWVPPPG